MFCPKCGTKNPETGKFCRKCGTDLGTVSDAISGNLSSSKESKKHKKEKNTWESAMGSLFMGVAFLTISIILGVTNAANGQRWWYWMLIPAFAMIGAGVAKVIQLKQDTQKDISIDLTDDTKQINSQQQEALPPSQTEYVSPMGDSEYQTGDLVPPSVVENTTRHLEMDSEGQTMTLPEDKVS